MKPIFTIHHRETPGHGYYSLPGELMELVPEKFRQREYEEDLEFVIPVVALKDTCDFLPHVEAQKKKGNSYYTTVENFLADCCQTMRDWMPEAYRELTGEVVTPQNSKTLERVEWYKKYTGYLLGFSAVNCDKRKGMVKVWVAKCLGADHSGHPILDTKNEVEIYVPSEEYSLRTYNWILGKPERLSLYEKV